MQIFKSFSELLSAYETFAWHAAVFVNSEEWAKDPKNAEILYLEGDDELEDIADEGRYLPTLAVEHGAELLLIVPTLQDVLAFQKGWKPNSTLDDYLFALNWYLEKDDFYDPTN